MPTYTRTALPSKVLTKVPAVRVVRRKTAPRALSIRRFPFLLVMRSMTNNRIIADDDAENRDDPSKESTFWRLQHLAAEENISIVYDDEVYPFFRETRCDNSIGIPWQRWKPKECKMNGKRVSSSLGLTARDFESVRNPSTRSFEWEHGIRVRAK